MPRIPVFKLGSSPADSQPPRLSGYTPALSLDILQLGIDNVRHDVWFSPDFTTVCGTHIAKLIAKFGNVEALMTAEPAASKNMFSKMVPGTNKKTPDLKALLLEAHKSALNLAKTQGNPTIDLLARAAIIKFLRGELNAQYTKALERCRAALLAEM